MFDPKKLGEEADQMIQELNQKLEAKKPEVTEEQPEEKTEAIAQEVVETQPDDQGVASTAQPIETTAAEQPAEQPANAELELLKKQVEASEQKWRVLQGMINKKDEEIESMRTLFAQINAAPAQSAAEAELTTKVENLVTKKDVEDYGSDLVDFVKRAAKSIASEEIARIEAKMQDEVSKLRSSVSTVEQTTVKTAQDLFFDNLTKKVPEWREINTRPAFLDWLNQVDPFAGVPRMQLLQNAVTSADAERASVFFSTYKSMTEPVVDATAESVADPAQTQKAKVERFVSPGKSKSSTAKVEGEKQMWTRAAIAKLYDDKMAGKISAKRFEELERDIFAAQQEGRIAA